MTNNLPIIKKNNKVALQKSKSLMTITSKILSNDNWMQNLWKWADENYVLDYCWYINDNDEGGFWGGLPRTKDALINLTEFVHCVNNENREVPSTYNNKLKIPKEIENLVNLIEINIWEYDSIEIPKEIENLINLKSLSLDLYSIEEIPKEICNIPNLMSLFCDGEFTKLPKEIKNITNKLTGLSLSSRVLTEVPNEICELINLTKLGLGWNKLSKLPKEIKNLTELTILHLSSNELIDLPEELCELINLTKLSLGWNKLTKLPKELVNLTELKELDLRYNPNLILTTSQIEWVRELINNGCNVRLNERYKNLYKEFELQRRYDYLDEFNIGRKVPITPEILDEHTPASITNKLARGEITFEEYLDEASDYLVYLDKEKFNALVQRLHGRDENLGRCFEQNITFNSYEDNKLIWTSVATGEDKKMLIAHWSAINNFVKEIFGSETKITNIAVSIE